MNNNSLTSMFDTAMANTDRRSAEGKEVTAKTGARVIANTDRRSAEGKEVTAKTGARVIANTNRRTDEVKEVTAKTGRRVMDHSDANHSETRRVIREESDRNIRILSDSYTAGEYIIALIVAVLAGIGAWCAEKTVFYIPVAFDNVGNPIKYSTDLTMAFIFTAAVAVAVFFLTLWLVHTIAKRFR